MTPAKSFGRFAAELAPNHLPGDVAQVARMDFIVTIAPKVAGGEDDGVRAMTETSAAVGGLAAPRFGDRRVRAPQAGWIDGAASRLRAIRLTHNGDPTCRDQTARA